VVIHDGDEAAFQLSDRDWTFPLKHGSAP